MTPKERSIYYKKWRLNNRKKRLNYMKKYNSDPSVISKNKLWRQKNKKRIKKLALKRKILSGWKPKTDWMYTKKLCRFCKKNKKYLMKSYKQGKRQYYSCRQCNTDRLKKYRATKVGAERTRVAVYKSIKKHWHKQVARAKLNYAVRTGKIKKPKRCVICNNTSKLEAHHKDYSKPLDVSWICKQCHCLV